MIENGTVVITGGKITAVGPASTPVPAGATRVDLKGKTLLPGLINAHGHVGNTVGLRDRRGGGYTRDNLLRQLKTYAQYGVTTVFSLGDDQAAGVRRCATKPATDRARLFVSGPVIGGDTAEAARANDDQGRRDETGRAQDPGRRQPRHERARCPRRPGAR